MASATMTAANSTCRRSVLDRFVWPAQALLAIVFGLVGGSNVFMSPGSLTAQMPWVSDVPTALVRGIGLVQIAAAAGLLVPGALRRFSHVPRLAAIALAALMVCTAAFDVSRGETAMIETNVGLGLLAAFVAWKRCS